MPRSPCSLALSLAAVLPATLSAQPPADFSGRWTLDAPAIATTPRRAGHAGGGRRAWRHGQRLGIDDHHRAGREAAERRVHRSSAATICSRR